MLRVLLGERAQHTEDSVRESNLRGGHHVAVVRSAARRVVIPRSVAIAVTDAAGASRSGKVQRYRGSITASGCHERLHRGSSGAARDGPQEAERRTRGLRAAVSRPCRRSSQSRQSTSNGLATKIDE